MSRRVDVTEAGGFLAPAGVDRFPAEGEVRECSHAHPGYLSGPDRLALA